MMLSDWLQKTTKQLEAISTTPKLDAEVLLLFVMHINKTKLYSHPEMLIPQHQLETLNILLQKRLSGIPLAYITGEKEFWSLSFKVSSDVLIPRPETEHLVEMTLDLLDPKEHHTLLELGTGSGAIAIAIAHERPHWTIIACDKSPQALEIAKENAKRLLPSQHASLSFCLSDWFNRIPMQAFSAIISNPPYIPEQDPHLDALQYEPISALSSGSDGLVDIRHIITQASNYLKSDGLLLLEHGYDQGKAIRSLLTKAHFTQIETISDLANQDRITLGRVDSV